MAARYPPFRGPRLAVVEAARCGGGPVAGRLVPVPGGLTLADASGSLPLESVDAAAAAPGDWVAGRLVRDEENGRLRLQGAVVLAPCGGPSPDPGLAARLPLLARRAAVVAAARELFRAWGFLEVETPAIVACPGLEPQLRAFTVRGAAAAPRWLITSPELHLKRLLAAGAERIVEFSRAFRDEERGAWHRPEFQLVEWYRAFAGLEALEADCEALVAACAAAVGVASTTDGCVFRPPFARTTVNDAVAEHSGLDLARLGERDDLARELARLGHHVADDDGWNELFFRLWVAQVEPQLGRSRPLFVRDWPASQAALARLRRGPAGDVAERFELYVAGIELANAFDELNDPAEQRRRHLADQAARRAAGVAVYPLDEAFLAALSSGMPPAAGIALGLDRLAAVLTGARSLDELVPFPAD